MDKFVEGLYSVSDAQQVTQFIREQFNTHSDSLVNLKDSSGSTLLHHLCIYFTDEQTSQFEEALLFLFSSDSPVQMNQQRCQNMLKGIPMNKEAKDKILS